MADITYLPTQAGESYLSLETDAWSRKIVGYHVHDTLQTRGVEQALRMALKERQTEQPLIHHSDRGVQYCSNSYQQLHAQNGLRCSITDGYDCYQNALAERINGILKTEFLLCRPRDIEQARQMVKEAVAIYNEERPHLALQYKTPGTRQRLLVDRASERFPGHLIGICDNTRQVHFPLPDTSIIGKFVNVDIIETVGVLALLAGSSVWVEE